MATNNNKTKTKSDPAAVKEKLASIKVTRNTTLLMDEVEGTLLGLSQFQKEYDDGNKKDFLVAKVKVEDRAWSPYTGGCLL